MRATIDGVRTFNRFYTGVLGLLGRHFLESRYSLTEVRVLYEIAHNESCTAKAIRVETGIDAGYLSRILDSFLREGLIRRKPARADKRYRILELSQKGQEAFARLNAAQDRSIEALVAALSKRDREELVNRMERIQVLLGGGRDGQNDPGADQNPQRA